MSAPRSGNYPIERRRGEIERLYIQAAALVADTEIMLDRIGVGAGWRCLDLGCGPGGITALLAARAGPSGRVVGLDADRVFLEEGRSRIAGVEFIEGDAYATRLPSGSFDLVHMRFIAGTAGAPERLIGEAMRLVRPGGTVALQEPDIATLNCHPPHPAWDRLKAALVAAFAVVGADVLLGRRLFALVRHAGLDDVQYRPFLIGVRSIDPMVDYLPATAESLRATILGRGIMAEAELDRALAECRAHLARPDTVFTMYTVAQVWGRKPSV
ncbi:MAG TPA: methyltransferase domain-containing protein [Alphaproteobacteria bacterium]|jgi:SAM-dependent methyltransferase